MVKRFVDDVQFRPTDPTTGAAAGQMALAQRLEQFADMSRQIAQREAIERGAEEAQQVEIARDEQGRLIQPAQRDMTFFDALIGGAETKAFNQTLQNGYLASLENDIRQNVARIEETNKADLTEFNEQAQGYAAGVLKGVEGPARTAVAQYLDRQITASRVTVQTNTLRKAEAEAQSEIITAIEQAGMQAANEARQGKPVASANALQDAFANIDSLVETGRISADQGARQKRELEREATEQTFRHSLDQTADSEGIQEAYAQLDAMSQKVPKGWTPDEWDTFIASAQADLNQKATRAARLEAEQNIELSREISNLKIQARTGTGNADDIVKRTEELFNAGQINESERTSIFTNLIDEQQRQRQEAIDFTAVAERLKGDDAVVLDDNTVDKYYQKQELPAYELLPPLEQEARKAFFVDRTKRVPAAMKAEIQTWLQSENTDLIAQAASLIDRIDRTPGLVGREFSATERAFADSVVKLTANMEPREATQLARKLTDPTDQARINTVTQTIKDDKLSEKYRDIVDSHFRPIFFTDVDDISGDQLATEYGDLFEAHYKAGMSEQTAKETALKIIERNWGVSDVTGRVMKYPPDQYYQIAGSVDYIRPQLTRDVNDNFMFEGESITSDQVFLQATEETARTASQGQPVYRVVINRDGNLEPLYGMSWRPDTQAQLAVVEEETKARMEQQRKAATPEALMGSVFPAKSASALLRIVTREQ